MAASASLALGYTLWQTRRQSQMAMEIMRDDAEFGRLIDECGRDLILAGTAAPVVQQIARRARGDSRILAAAVPAYLTMIRSMPRKIALTYVPALIAISVVGFILLSPWALLLCGALFFGCAPMRLGASAFRELQRDIGGLLYIMSLWYYADPRAVAETAEGTPVLMTIYAHGAPIYDEIRNDYLALLGEL